ncbi:MAG: hypothetical protein NC400_03320 [Clostridium sp.]|nr:hypothetical protein [Clostridium sp.]
MSKLLRKLNGGKGKKNKRRAKVEELEWLDFDEDDADEEEYDEEAYGDEEYEDDNDEYEDDGEEYEDEYDDVDGGEYDDAGEYEDDSDEYNDADEYEDEYDDDADAEEYDGDAEKYADDEEAYEDDDGEYEDDEEYNDDYDDVDEEEDDTEYEDDDEEYEEDEYDDEDDDAEYEDDSGEYEDEYDDVDEEYDEYEDEYDDDIDDEEYDDDDEEPESGIGRLLYKITNMSTVDYVVALTGVAVLVLAIVTGTLYFGARSNKAQIEAFAEIGEGMEAISVIGEEGLVAIADAQAARLMAASMEEDEEEQQEEETSGKKEVLLNFTSIQKDLKIKFVEKKSGKLVSGIPFEVEIEKPSGEIYSKKDDDEDGIIYEKNIAPGKYKVKISAPSSNEEYSISGEAIAITVKDTIEYKKVDIADEVKTEAEVNAAAEDTKVNETVVESTNTDTVEWVESTKTIIEGTEKTEEKYEKIEKDKIADPEKKASAAFRLLSKENEGNGARTGDFTSDTAGDPAKPAGNPTSESGKPTPDPEGGQGGNPTQQPAGDPTSKPEGDPTSKPAGDPTSKPAGEPTSEPTSDPASAPTKEPTAAPTNAPTQTPTAVPTATAAATATPTAKPSATPSAAPSATPTATPGGARTDTKTTLRTTDGEKLYVMVKKGEYREAKYADYYNKEIKEFYRKISETTGSYRYTGWQELDGKTYFFDKNGNAVTGEQVIQGAKYTFNSDGSLNNGSGHMGIDVSKWNGSIDWNAVKNSGVSFVIIRCGYRGSSTGALIEDPKFRSNIQGAAKAGLKVGVYFFTQAVNEVEAVEEASMAVNLVKGYNISYPVFLDVESSNGGRGDGIDTATRTAVCRAFCQTVQNSGYKAGIYANKTWFNSHIDAPSLTSYKIWLAQYAAAPSYTRTKYDMWQYSSKGKIAGISTDVDMNISYMGY